MPAIDLLIEESEVPDTGIGQDSPVWDPKCRKDHLSYLDKPENIPLYSAFARMGYEKEKIQNLILDGKVAILEHLPYRKQVRVRAAIGSGLVKAKKIDGNVKTIVFDTASTFKNNVRLIDIISHG